MPAALYNFVCEQYADFARTLNVQNPDGSPFDLTNFSAQMAIRQMPAGTLLLEVSSHLGGIVLGGTAGTLAISIPAAETATIIPAAEITRFTQRLVAESATPGVEVSGTGWVCKYDILLVPTSGSGAFRLLEGIFCVVPGITEGPA